MIISYDNLWKLLIDKKLNKTEIAKKTKISSSTMAKNDTRGAGGYDGPGENL